MSIAARRGWTYIRQADDVRLISLIATDLQAAAGGPLPEGVTTRLARGMAGLKPRAKTLKELADAALFYVRPRPIPLDDKAKKAMTDGGAAAIAAFLPKLESVEPWTAHALEELARVVAEASGQKLGAVAQPLRAALVGSTVSPPLFEVMEILGRGEALGRLRDAAGI